MSNLVNKLIKGTQAEKEEYNHLIVKLIRQKYSINDELAILRQQTTKPEEFNEYNSYVEECKKQAQYMMNIYNENK